MNKPKLINLLSELEKDICACKREVEDNWLRKTISGEPAIVNDLQRAVINVMLAAAEKDEK